jgi:hypothetical protein
MGAIAEHLHVSIWIGRPSNGIARKFCLFNYREYAGRLRLFLSTVPV